MEILETKGRKMNKIKREEREDLHTFSDTTEVAFNSGYNTPTLFYEQFLREIHLSPNEYRQHINAEKISNHMNITIGSPQDSTHSK